MYHRVFDKVFDPRQISVSRQHFEEHMQVIKKYGRVVQMREMGMNLKRFPIGSNEIVVTLDDGYADNYHNARPILERHEIPATFFVVSGSIGSQNDFWWNDLAASILAPRILPELFESTVAGTKYSWKIASEGPCHIMDYSQSTNGVPQDGITLSRSTFYYVVMQLLATVSLDERRDVLLKIADWAGQSLASELDALPMTSEEIVSLANSPLFEIGAHTANHAMLSLLPQEKQEEEISRSKLDLESMLNQKIDSFSYPYGNYSNDTVKLVEGIKFKNACTVLQQPVMRNSNPYLLPRFAVLNWNGDQFEQHLRAWLT